MVNTHRYRTAYILVGVEEVKGSRSKAVGVDQHWEDASLHQFVNSKTNRPAAFSYFPFNFDGKSIGVFSIPIQRLPVYLLAKYGKSNPNTATLETEAPRERLPLTKPPTWDAPVHQGLLNGQLTVSETWHEEPLRPLLSSGWDIQGVALSMLRARSTWVTQRHVNASSR